MIWTCLCGAEWSTDRRTCPLCLSPWRTPARPWWTPRRQLALGVALWLGLFVIGLLTVGGCVRARRDARRWACPCTPSRGEIPLPGRDDDWRQRR